MLTYLLKRLLGAVPVVIGVLLLTFAIRAAIPTDAVAALFEGQVTEQEAKQASAVLRERYGLDLPWYRQFARYVNDVAHGDLGESIRTRQPVADEIGWRYVNTLELTFA